MKFKAIALGAMMLIVAAALAGCAPAAVPAPTAAPTEVATAAPEVTTEATTDAAETSADALLELTLEELAAFDGKDGRRAYVAIDGTIYDVTDIPAWSGGDHSGNTAGKDLTEAIKNSPHGQSVLSELPVVGKLK